MTLSRVPPRLLLERTPALRVWRWLRPPRVFESHAPRALHSGDDSRLIRGGNPAAVVDFLFADAPPRAAIAFQQVVCLDRTPRACRIVRETAGRQSVPNVQDGLNHIPSGFDHVRALEERGIARHTIAQQSLVASAVLQHEIGGVIEIHIPQAELHDRAGNLCAEAERDAFLGLNMDDEAVGFQISYRRVTGQDEGSPAELDHDLRRASREPLSRAQIERHARPAPVVDLQFQSDKRFRVRIRRDIWFAAIANDALAVHHAGAVLAADHVFQDIFGIERLDGVQDFGLFIADLIGIEGNGRLHRRHGQELEQVVRHHVAQGACGLIESAAMLHADGFRRGDLNVVHIIAVPQRLDDVVRKAKDHYILDSLFAEIVIDAVDLLFRQNLLQLLVELLRRFQIMAEWLFDDAARPAPVFFFRQAGFAQLLDDRGEESWRDRQIEESVSERVMKLVSLFNLLFQPFVGFGVLKIAPDVVDSLGNPVPEL